MTTSHITCHALNTLSRDNLCDQFIICVLVTGEICCVDPRPVSHVWVTCLMSHGVTISWCRVWAGAGASQRERSNKGGWRILSRHPAVKHNTLHLAPPARLVINCPHFSPHRAQITWVSPHLLILMTLSVLSYRGWFDSSFKSKSLKLYRWSRESRRWESLDFF